MSRIYIDSGELLAFVGKEDAMEFYELVEASYAAELEDNLNKANGKIEKLEEEIYDLKNGDSLLR